MKERNNRRAHNRPPKKVAFAPQTVEGATALLYEKTAAAYGEEWANRIILGSVRKTTCFRVNSIKGALDEVLSEIKESGLTPAPVGFYEDAFFLPENSEGALSFLSAYEKGEIYLQNPSSMLPPLLLGAKRGEDVLDACAAPGGKTAQIAALTGNGANITACEKNAARAEKLRYTLAKQGVRATVLETDALALSPYLRFDRVLLDAPCSGSGTLDFGNEKTCRAFSGVLISSVVNTQKKLMEKALSLLKKGGTLVYSTCSVLPEENEGVIRFVLSLGGVSLVPVTTESLGDVPTLPSMPGTLTVCPTNAYEGFFVAILKKEK